MFLRAFWTTLYLQDTKKVSKIKLRSGKEDPPLLVLVLSPLLVPSRAYGVYEYVFIF